MSRRGAIAAGLAFLLLAASVAGALSLSARLRRDASRFAPPAPILHRTKTPFEVAESVLHGKLQSGWDDWGWGAHVAVDGGGIAVAFDGYGGIILHHTELPSHFGALTFRFRAPAGFGDFLDASLRSGQLDEKALPRVAVDARYVVDLADGWKEALIPWATLNPTGIPFDRIVIQARRLVGAEPVRLDEIGLTKPPLEPQGAAPAPARAGRVAVMCAKPATRISPLIYGMAGTVWETGATGRRIGGNPVTRMNWDLGAWNTGSDWYFENMKSPALEELLDEALAHHAKTALVVPMIGWVAKDTTSVGFPISKLGPQKAHDPSRPEAGSGVAPNDHPLDPGPPSETSIPAPPALIHGWIDRLRKEDATKGVRRIDTYILDNEPNLWNSTHRDVHPEPLGYDELLDRTIRYGQAIRDADPDGTIAGPAEWGWTGYLYSAKDQKGGVTLRLDRRAHGDTPLIPWYLRKLAEHDKQAGRRILDVLDLHFYPQAPGISSTPGRTDPEGAALRLRSTRSLWDPTYKDESWINDTVKLIPRMKAWIAENYPGLGIQIGEWSFGGETHVSGGLAIAEVLGRFGQQGIRSAYYWLAPPAGSPGAQAFRAYRNFDGKGASFLDWSVPTETPPGVSFFASKDGAGTHVVAVLLNLDATDARALEIDVTQCGKATSRRVFAYGMGSRDFVPEPQRAEGNLLHERIEPYSMKVLDITIRER